MVGVIDEIKENVEEGEKDIEELIKKGKKEIKKLKIGKAVKKIEVNIEKDTKKVKEMAMNIIEKTRDNIEKDVGEGIEKVEGIIKKTVEKMKSKARISEKAEKESTTEEKTMEEKDKKSKISSSSSDGKSIEERKKVLLEKAKKLRGKLEKTKTEDLKEKVKLKRRADMLVPLEEYVKAGIYLGTRVVTPDMRPFVYRRRADGLAIFNTDLIDEKLKEGIEFLSGFAPEDVILVCKRQAGWEVAEKFSEITGIRTFTRKYPAGILTNKQLPNFFENELTIVTDHWVDKNALNDTLKVGKKVLMICDTNNFSKGADKVIIGNNKSSKSIGFIFYLLARGYCKARGIKADIPDLEWWAEETEEAEKKKAIRLQAGARFGV